MKAYFFIYNVVLIKINLSELQYEAGARFILIGSDYCINKLSVQNQAFFHQIHRIERNFHQIDLNQVESILSSYLKSHQSEDILLLTNEDSTQVACAKLREKYNIPGVTESEILPYVNKDISKRKLLGKVRVPHFTLLDKKHYQMSPDAYQQNLIETIGFPMFLKPIDLVSSIGTHYITNEASLKSALELAFQAPWDSEIDEFIEGDLFHCDFIVQNKEIAVFMAGKYAYGLAEFSKGRPMGSIPVTDQNLLLQLKEFSVSALDSLGVFSSAFHIEVFQERNSRELVFLEAAARTPGALVPEMYERILNQHLEHLHYQAQIGREIIPPLQPICSYAGWITYPQISGTLEQINVPVLNIEHQFMSTVSLGQNLKNA